MLADCVTHNIEIEGETVTIKKLSVADQKEIGEAKDDFEAGIIAVEKSILRWSFKNGNAPLAVSKDNIMRIRADVILKIGEEIKKFNNGK